MELLELNTQCIYQSEIQCVKDSDTLFLDNQVLRKHVTLHSAVTRQ